MQSISKEPPVIDNEDYVDDKQKWQEMKSEYCDKVEHHLWGLCN